MQKTKCRLLLFACSEHIIHIRLQYLLFIAILTTLSKIIRVNGNKVQRVHEVMFLFYKSWSILQSGMKCRRVQFLAVLFNSIINFVENTYVTKNCKTWHGSLLTACLINKVFLHICRIKLTSLDKINLTGYFVILLDIRELESSAKVAR
jgi:hypothetical protein